MRLTAIIDKNLDITYDSPDLYASRCKKLLGDKESQRVRVEIKKDNARSMSQNAYFWAVIIPLIADEAGYRADEHYQLHKDLKEKFFWEMKINKLTGEERKQVKSLSEANSEEATKYVNDVIDFGVQFYNLTFPNSEEYWSK